MSFAEPTETCQLDSPLGIMSLAGDNAFVKRGNLVMAVLCGIFGTIFLNFHKLSGARSECENRFLKKQLSSFLHRAMINFSFNFLFSFLTSSF